MRGQLNNVNARTMIDAYRSCVDDLAAQLQLSSDNMCGVPGGHRCLPRDFWRSVRHWYALYFPKFQQAFACDLASSITYGIGGEKINQLKHAHLYDAEQHSDDSLKTLLASNYHAVSHKVSDEANEAHELVRIDQSKYIAFLLDSMSITPDVDGNSVLDNTVVF